MPPCTSILPFYLFRLCFVKVIIARKYKNEHSILMPLGLSIYAVSGVLVLIRVLPYALGKITASSSIAKYSPVLIVLFCVSMAGLALRPPASSPTKTPTGSMSTQPSSKPRSDSFSLELVRNEVQTPDARTLCFRVQDGEQLIAKPGQFLTLHPDIEGKQVARSYSICSSLLKTDYIEITQKRTKNGYVSVFLNERATPVSSLGRRGLPVSFISTKTFTPKSYSSRLAAASLP